MGEEERLADIIGEWRDRCDRGEEVTPEQVIHEHPELAEELRSHFDILGAVEHAFEGSGWAPPGQIGEYRVLSEIGRGGMGVVYEAEQASMQRRVALKVLSLAVTSSPQAVARFRREAQAAGRIHHTNIVPVHSMGQHGGHWYYAMELVEGRPLSDVIRELRERKLRPSEVGLAQATLGDSVASDAGRSWKSWARFSWPQTHMTKDSRYRRII